MDVLDILRRQAGRFQCPKCGQSLAGCQLDLVARADEESLVKVTCAHCLDTRLIAVAVSTEAAVESPRMEVRDQPAEELAPVSSDEVLDVRLALARYDGDLNSLVR